MSSSSARHRQRIVSFRLEPEDYDRLSDVARPLSPGQFARTASLEAAGLVPEKPGRRPLPKVKDAALLREVLAEMGHWGGNLNQLAHQHNMGLPFIANVDQLRRDLEPIKRRLLVALGVID